MRELAFQRKSISGKVDEPVLVVFASSEKVDEKDPTKVSKETVEEIIDIARQV
ncbi:MAG: hypothetical protein ACUVTD_02535 [Nitrososphaerales archaeon]